MPSTSAFWITGKWFFVINEMNMAHTPRAGHSQVDSHVRNRDRREEALPLGPPGSLADPATGGLAPLWHVRYRALVCGPVSVQGAEDPETKKPEDTANAAGGRQATLNRSPQRVAIFHTSPRHVCVR